MHMYATHGLSSSKTITYFLPNNNKQKAQKTIKTRASVKNNRSKMEGYVKPQATKLRLNYSFDLSQKWNLKPVQQESPGQH